MMLVVEQNRDTVWSSSSRLVQIALNLIFRLFLEDMTNRLCWDWKKMGHEGELLRKTTPYWIK